MWHSYRSNCRRKNIYFDMEREHFIQMIQRPCHYCGRPPANVMENYVYNGIDRKENKRGYYPGNAVTCCFSCNSIKGDHLSYRQMKALGKVLRLFWSKGKYKKSRG